MNLHIKLRWKRFTADKKRFRVLCALVGVVLLLWARIIVIERPPRTAIAETVVEVAMLAASNSDNKSVKVVFDADPKKNPFMVSSIAFPLRLDTPDNTYSSGDDSQFETEQHFADQLKLDAVMGKMAMINGHVYHIGDIVSGHEYPDPLRLVEVVGRSVIISSGDRRYELTIASHLP